MTGYSVISQCCVTESGIDWLPCNYLGFTYLLLTKFEVRTVSYGLEFFPLRFMGKKNEDP